MRDAENAGAEKDLITTEKRSQNDRQDDSQKKTYWDQRTSGHKTAKKAQNS